MSRLFSYYLGLDLGQSADYTALALIEEPVWDREQWVSPQNIPPDMLAYLHKRVHKEGRPANPVLSLRHLERFPLGTRYPAIVERVKQMLDTPPLAGKPVELLVDKTGVGAGVVDSFYHAGVYPLSITIHGGGEVTLDRQHYGYRVPKRDLVGAVQILLQNRRLKIAASLPEAETLRSELLNFRVKVDPRTAHESYEHWREDDHDDLVLAAAMACWFREWWNQKLEVHYATSFPSQRAS